jgi:hypothetical protein
MIKEKVLLPSISVPISVFGTVIYPSDEGCAFLRNLVNIYQITERHISEDSIHQDLN